MKIKSIETVKLNLPPRNGPTTTPRRPSWADSAEVANPMTKFSKYKRHRSSWMPPWGAVWVKATAEDGTWGIGQTAFGRPVAAVIDDHFSPMLVGENCFAVEKIWDMMFRMSKPYGSLGLTACAMSGVDLAIWDLIGKLNRAVGVDYPEDPDLRARIRSYELAAGMQTAVPRIMNFSGETAHTQSLYGLDEEHSRPFGRQCLAARRLVENGVRFVQLYHGAGSAGTWDGHSDMKRKYDIEAPKVDKPIAGLLRDLKQRGLLDTTLVVFGTEFGRTPGAQGGTGRDHHPQGFMCWLAGGGIRGGITHGATDELGFYAVEDPHYVTDVHATVLHQLGIDPRHLGVPGRKRIDAHRGKPITEIIA